MSGHAAGFMSGRHRITWRVVSSTPDEEQGCGCGIGVVSVRGDNANGARPLTSDSPAIRGQYLHHTHHAWFFECRGTRSNSPDDPPEPYGRSFATGDLVSVEVDMEASGANEPERNGRPCGRFRRQ